MSGSAGNKDGGSDEYNLNSRHDFLTRPDQKQHGGEIPIGSS